MTRLFLGTLLVFSLFFKASIAEESSFVARDFSDLLQMPGWNKDLLQMHFTLYQGYVKNTNLLLEEISELNKMGKSKSYEFGALKRRFGWEFDGMRLHELYFENLSKEPLQEDLEKTLVDQMQKDFGSFEAWKQDFIATGLMRGIGWVVLYQDRLTQRLCNVWINEHDTGHLVLGDPLLVMDVFEHAYITQFGLDKAKYIDLFFKSLNFSIFNQRWLSISSKSFSNLKSEKNDHNKAE